MLLKKEGTGTLHKIRHIFQDETEPFKCVNRLCFELVSCNKITVKTRSVVPFRNCLVQWDCKVSLLSSEVILGSWKKIIASGFTKDLNCFVWMLCQQTSFSKMFFMLGWMKVCCKCRERIWLNVLRFSEGLKRAGGSRFTGVGEKI